MATTTYGLTPAAVDLVLALSAEAGDDMSTPLDDMLYGCTGNHHPDDIEDAASGDVAALIDLRQAFGLPIFR